MSIPYVASGRINQKRRTETALIEAARSLAARGATPTVEEVASEAGISRTTAYRYFKNQRQLLIAAFPAIDRTSLLGEDPPQDVEQRLAIVIDLHLRFTVENEVAIRTALWFSLDPQDRQGSVLRQGRAIGWILEALSPLRGELSSAELERLARAIRATAGVEALVWLTDVGGMSRDDAVALMKWSSVALLRAARAGTPPS